jgi:predicted nucleic acid-binding protein
MTTGQAHANISATNLFIFDAGPLGQLANPRANVEVAARAARIFSSGSKLFISEAADYEVRRNLLLHGRYASITRLDELQVFCQYVPITTRVMRKTAEFWADSRRRGKPTSDPKELDCDVILAAQAVEFGATIITDNIGHLSQFAVTKRWADL